jgi:LysM repeat protein
MPESQPNQVARVIAVLALVAAFLLVVITIATSGGGSDGGGSEGADEDSSGPTAVGRRALENGVWVVREGDTLNEIAEETGLSEDELLELNPDIDPQILVTGQRISLRTGGTGDEGDEPPDASSEPTPSADEAGGSGVGDDGPTGTTGSGVSDGITD